MDIFRGSGASAPLNKYLLLLGNISKILFIQVFISEETAV